VRPVGLIVKFKVDDRSFDLFFGKFRFTIVVATRQGLQGATGEKALWTVFYAGVHIWHVGVVPILAIDE
jgi:hypothetical protein